MLTHLLTYLLTFLFTNLHTFILTYLFTYLHTYLVNSSLPSFLLTKVVVVFPPQFVIKPPPSLNATVGKNVKIPCAVKGTPKPVVTWQRENRGLPAGRTEVHNDGLLIKNARVEDSGKYFCIASSVSNQKSKTFVQLKGESLSSYCNV